MSYIAKFNPYRMDDTTVIALATGRIKLLDQVLNTLKSNIRSESLPQQLLIRGPKGFGKSFFLKYLKINFKKQKEFRFSEFVLLPEEQSIINSPSDLVQLILHNLKNTNVTDDLLSWEENDESWLVHLENIKKYIAKKRKQYKEYILVVSIENIDQFLNNIRSDKKTAVLNESRFRHLLEKIEGLNIIAAIPQSESDVIDGNYNKRIFHAFKKCNINKWTEADCIAYLERRKLLKEAETGIKYKKNESKLILAKLKAFSKFTGGSPRITAILTNLLLDSNSNSTNDILLKLTDDLSPYYKELTDNIPAKSKILFDALIRKDENLSQSELAAVLGATQNKISKAFKWLIENDYVVGTKRSNSPSFSYQIADRIYVLYYQLREIYSINEYTPVSILSQFLISFYISGNTGKNIKKQTSANSARSYSNAINNLQEVFKTDINVSGQLINFFINYLKAPDIENDLIKDVAEEALRIFKEKEQQTIIKVILNTIKYLESDRNSLLLEELNPDEGIFIKAISKELIQQSFS